MTELFKSYYHNHKGRLHVRVNVMNTFAAFFLKILMTLLCTIVPDFWEIQNELLKW